MKKEQEEWINWAKQKKRFVSFYKQKVLDLTEFVQIHPGGRKSLETYIYKDVSEVLFSVYPHKKETTTNTLFKYTIGVNISYDQRKNAQKQNNTSQTKNSKSKKKVCFRNTVDYNIQKKDEPKSQYRKSDSTEKRQSIIRKTINQRSLTKKRSNKKYDVSIKLISESQAEQWLAAIKQKECPPAKRSEIDLNIKQQDIQQSSIISKVPILEVKRINR